MRPMPKNSPLYSRSPLEIQPEALIVLVCNEYDSAAEPLSNVVEEFKVFPN